MIRAPAGDLYDVQVHSDEDLVSFESHEIATSAFDSVCCALKDESSSWADLYSAVEVRRLRVYSYTLLY
jgi:hypothetical protein